MQCGIRVFQVLNDENRSPRIVQEVNGGDSSAQQCTMMMNFPTAMEAQDLHSYEFSTISSPITTNSFALVPANEDQSKR